MLSVYPSITSSEFAAACEALEKRCHDRLYGTSWRIVKWTRTELQIRQNRPLATNSSIATIRGDGPGGAHVGRDDETEAALDEVPDIEDCDEEMVLLQPQNPEVQPDILLDHRRSSDVLRSYN